MKKLLLPMILYVVSFIAACSIAPTKSVDTTELLMEYADALTVAIDAMRGRE